MHLAHQIGLVGHLVWRSFSLRYKRSVLGVLWSLVPSLAQLLVLVFLFGKVVPLKIEAYPAFVFSALLPWIWFSTCLNSAGNLFIDNRSLLRRPNFAPSTLVITDTLSHVLHFLIFLPILIFLMILYSRPLTFCLLFLPLLLFVQFILTVGLSFLISTLNVFYRDIQHIVGVAVMLMFYITPVFYQAQMIPKKYQLIYELNPMGLLVQNYRRVFFYGSMPDWNEILISCSISLVLFFLGYTVYLHKLNDVYDTP